MIKTTLAASVLMMVVGPYSAWADAAPPAPAQPPQAALAIDNIQPPINASVAAITRNVTALSDYALRFALQVDHLTEENAKLSAQLTELTKQLADARANMKTEPVAKPHEPAVGVAPMPQELPKK